MKGRPAETAGGVGAIGLLVAFILGVDDPSTVVMLGAAIALLPALVTGLVDGGGVRGWVRKLWRGRDTPAT